MGFHWSRMVIGYVTTATRAQIRESIESSNFESV